MIEIIHGDLLELDCAELFGMADALITDPPYSDHVHENATSIGTGGAGVRERDLEFEPLSPRLRECIAIGASVVKRWSVVFSDFEGADAWRVDANEAGAEWIRLVPWVRWSQPQLSGDRPCTGAEAVLVWHAQHVGARGGRRPIAKRWNGPGSLTCFDRKALRGQFKHPTEKPLDLMLDIVSWFSDPGEVVIDPCAGAGTTALACRLLGRACIAVEKKATWVRQAQARVRGPLSGRDLERAERWIEATATEAESVREPRDESEVRTYERAQRRIADAARVFEALGKAA
jgi:site-specific DNA-methyltransferase (adenine-specific)